MDQFLAEIRIFAGNYAPRGWAQCNGQLLPITQNTALYSLLGLTFGGDGRTTFGLPNLQGRAAVCTGSGAGLTQRYAGAVGGESTVTLTASNLPAHTHTMDASSRAAGSSSPTPAGGTALAVTAEGSEFYDGSAGSAEAMSGSAIGGTGGGAAHNNLQPYQALTYIIAIIGDYPVRP